MMEACDKQHATKTSSNERVVMTACSGVVWVG